MTFNFGNRLIEIAALTTIIGATTVESLALGSRGAGGLPWAAMSSFGCFHLIKASVAAAMPSWLRESFGVNSFHCCSILGLYSPLDERSMLKVAPEAPVGISVKLDPGGGNDGNQTNPCIDSIYAFDEYTTGIVQSCPSFRSGKKPRVFAYARGEPSSETGDWIAIIATLLKLVETTVLWIHAGWQLSLASTGSWAFFFIAAIVLQSVGISREYKGSPSKTPTRDIISGDFPTIYGGGRELKIILGVPVNVRTHLIWPVLWGIGGLVSLSTVVATHLLLDKGTAKQFYLWMAFQCLWLFARIFFYHFAVITDGRRHPVVEQGVLDQRERLLALSSGVSRHLAQLHPRASESYLQDAHNLLDVRSDIDNATFRLNWSAPFGDETDEKDEKAPPIPLAKPKSFPRVREYIDIEILAVVGDTTLSSIAWIHGCDISTAALYDSCLVILKIDNETFLIPSARVLAGNAKQASAHPTDIEAGISPRFVPRYGPGRGDENGWVYWVPLGSDRWLHLICGLDCLGKQQAEVLDSLEVSRRLMLGALWVSLKSVEAVKKQVERAAIVGQTLLFYFDLEADEERFVRVARPRFPP